MSARLHSVLISHHLTPLFGLNLCGYGQNAEAFQSELAAAEEVLQARYKNVHLIDLDLAGTGLNAESAPLLRAFLRAHPGGPHDPLHKLAVIGVSSIRRQWWRWKWQIAWPPSARFFSAHEDAKAWLVSER